MRNKLLMLLIVLMVNACATSPVPVSSAKPVPKERMLAFQDKTPETTATIVVIRDKGMTGSACYLGVYVNKIFAARLSPREKATLYVKPGEILLKGGTDAQGNGLCSIQSDMWTQQETIMKDGETKYFRLSVIPDGKIDIQRTDE